MFDDEADAQQFLAEAMLKVAPLINDLAKQVGESIEAWRGIDMMISGMSTIMESLMDFGMSPREQVIIVATIYAAIDDHPALNAARQHYSK